MKRKTCLGIYQDTPEFCVITKKIPLRQYKIHFLTRGNSGKIPKKLGLYFCSALNELSENSRERKKKDWGSKRERERERDRQTYSSRIRQGKALSAEEFDEDQSPHQERGSVFLARDLVNPELQVSVFFRGERGARADQRMRPNQTLIRSKARDSQQSTQFIHTYIHTYLI